MKLTGYVLEGHSVNIRPAPLERAWMDATPERFAYRCLPLNIANRHGWEVLSPGRIVAVWDGGAGKDAIRISGDDGGHIAVSHFGSGVLTFHVPVLFRTDAGYDLFITGPVNRPKDGIGALTGVVETDWAPYTFTMNWLFTRRDHPVIFEAGEPICHFFPTLRGALEVVRPSLEAIGSNEDLNQAFSIWSRGRDAFNKELAASCPIASKEGWQKAYFRGRMPDGANGAADHVSKLRLTTFALAGDGS